MSHDERCLVCGSGFSEEEWDLRHTPSTDELAEVHAECCPECSDDVTNEEWDVAMKEVTDHPRL
jgi:RNA polymerase subunit RPABC4/transcription elongation factor Spt4